jgi:hypothetical protein
VSDSPATAATSAERDPGQRPLALGIGLTVVALLVLLPWLVAPLSYLVITVVAIVAGSDLSAATVNVPALAIGLAAVVVVLTIGIVLLAGLLGRPLSPKR